MNYFVSHYLVGNYVKNIFTKMCSPWLTDDSKVSEDCSFPGGCAFQKNVEITC